MYPCVHVGMELCAALDAYDCILRNGSAERRSWSAGAARRDRWVGGGSQEREDDERGVQHFFMHQSMILSRQNRLRYGLFGHRKALRCYRR
jgi:hypothetical protein